MTIFPLRGLGVAAAIALSLLTIAPQATADPGEHGGTVTVMTRNVYLGTELGPIFGAPNIPALFTAVGTGYANVEATDFRVRAELIANEIAAQRPDLVGLQEVALFRTDIPPDGPGSPAAEVSYDYLQLILAALEARGLEYDAAAVHVGTDAELPAGFPPARDVRMTLRDVILVRRDGGPRIHLEGASSGSYATRVVVQTAAGPVTAKRGWSAVDVKIRGRHFRFVNTHLEAFSAPVQVAQAAEVVAGPAATDKPVILVGDFNSRPDGWTTTTYANLIANGFSDSWAAAHPGEAGLTCCHDRPALRNALPNFYERIDYVLTRGPFVARHVEVVGDEQHNRAPDGLWPADHAGVVATLWLRNSD